MGSIPKCETVFGPPVLSPGSLGSIRQRGDLGSVPKPEMSSILTSGRRLTVPVTYEDSGIESSEFQDIAALRQGGDGKDEKSTNSEMFKLRFWVQQPGSRLRKVSTSLSVPSDC